MEWWCSNIKRKAIGILHGLVKIYHCCFAKDIYVITDHKLLLGMLSKDVVMLQLQCIMLHIHQYSIHILYKPGPELYLADWLLCHNHLEKWDQEISGINMSIHYISTSVTVAICISIEDI